MGALTDLPSPEEIQERIKERYDSLYYVNVYGERQAYVCVLCDKFIINKDDLKSLSVPKVIFAKDVLKWSSQEDDRRTHELQDHYQAIFEARLSHPSLEGLALSPRAPIYKSKGIDCFSCCGRCYHNIQKPKVPRHAIINSNCVGAAPKCLLDLTEPELAFLTPVKHYGYCFTFTGGKQKCLKGTLSYMRVSRKSIVKSVATLESFGLNQNVLVLYAGKLTKWQQDRAKELCSVRTHKLIEAVDWLCRNNKKWRHLDKDRVIEQLKKKEPVIIDKSDVVEGCNNNIEQQEVFTCYYPDGTVTPTNGGFEDPNGFKKYVAEMAEKGFDIEFQANLKKEYVSNVDGDLLVDSNILQFPYGIGGMNDRRELHDGSYTTRSDLDEYLQNLSLNSQPVFQRPLFQLMLYSLSCKHWLLKSSRLQLRGKTDAENLASGLNQKDVISCINGRRMRNKLSGTKVSRLLLDAVDATAASLPHTNEAAKKARARGEAMQHHFGMGSVFLTCTFDDENSLLMEVMSGDPMGDEVEEDLSDEEVTDRARKRRQLRIEHPGLAALNFEMLLDILLEEVIGWDRKRNKPMYKKVGKEEVRVKGYFGDVFAMSFAVEEQGRKTLHVHMTLWIEGFKRLQDMYFFAGKTKKNKAKHEIQHYTEHVGSTSFFPDNDKQAIKAFDHTCTVPLNKRKAPVTVDDQGLRNLRNKRGYKDSNGIFASCRHCPKNWTYEGMIIDYLENMEGLCQKTTKPNNELGADERCSVIPKARMKSRVIDFQKGINDEPPKPCIDALYQHHVSCHVKGCFKCQKSHSGKRKHVCGPNCECRFRLPDKKRRRAEIYVNQESISWYLWNGDVKDQPLCQISPKRKKYDLFQNTSCPAISYSKFSCNNNVSVILDGPIGQYQHKYQEKETQQDDTADYKEVEATIRKFDCDSRRHEDDRPEALRRICRAAFAHNKKNVISPCFASYLLRHGSRFSYSHDFKYCPLRDVIRLHNKEEIGGILKYADQGKEQFFENSALDYMCRNSHLEDLCLAHFTEQYCTVCAPQNHKEKEIFPFVAKTEHYDHPSVFKTGKRKGDCSRGSTARTEAVLFRVSQWMFPDTADFGANIFTCDESQFNNSMNTYAHLVLALFMPHRCRDDLREGSNFQYLRKLRNVYGQEMREDECDRVVFNDRNVSILQNIQNCRSNTLRYKAKDDPLTSCTIPYKSESISQDEDEEENDDDEVETSFYEEFLDMFGETSEEKKDDETTYDPNFLRPILQDFNFEHMRNRGKHRCGYRSDIPNYKMEDSDKPFVSRSRKIEPGPNDEKCDELKKERRYYKCEEVIRLIVGKKRPRVKKMLWENDKEQKSIKVRDADGSVRSIREWAKAAFKKDVKQQRAFEVLTASFVLTFFEEVEHEEGKLDDTQKGSHRTKHRIMKSRLKSLRGGSPENYNLICLLHGPGGSGKSTVINTVKAYAEDYCKNLNHEFTNRTIVVTAMSGVAATLLNGETTHSVLGLNRTKIDPSDALAWVDARLLIIDECSFASASDFEKMQENLKVLMANRWWKYGGINVVFAGDYSQLEPVMKEPIYKGGQMIGEFHGSLNCFIELDGKWRFKDDKKYGDILARMRGGRATEEDIDKLNKRVHKLPPQKIQVASHTNKDRDAINAAVFDDHTRHNKPSDGSTLKSAVMILMDELYMNDSRKKFVPVLNNNVLKHFYENCTEDECSYNKKSSKSRVDPTLKLYRDCPMMLTQNKDVAGGEANGSRVLVKEVKMKMGEEPFDLTLSNGTTILAAFASQVDSILVEHECETIVPRQFEVIAEDFTFITKIHDVNELLEREMYVTMKGTQFPLISNSCTTGHKLQGCSVDNILVNSWYYGSNWAYVVLSRVRTIKGLYMREPLSNELINYEPNKDMLDMLKYLRTKCAVDHLTDEEYLQLETDLE